MTKDDAINKFGIGEIDLEGVRQVYGMGQAEFAQRYVHPNSTPTEDIQGIDDRLTDQKKHKIFQSLVRDLALEQMN